MPVARESDLFGPVRDLLAAQGFDVHAEVEGCDVVARRGDELVVVELKRHLTVDLLAQAARRQKLTDSVYVAVPAPSRTVRDQRDVRHLLRRLELGLLHVHAATGHVQVVLQPEPLQRRREPRRTRALLAEIDGRHGNGNVGGANRQRLLTAYRERALHVAVALERFGPLRPRDLRALGTGPKTLAIVSDDVYGWFERVDRGLYRLGPGGEQGVAEWRDAADRHRAALPDELPTA